MDNLKTVKFGNVEFRIDDFKIKTKSEFKEAYKAPCFKFNRDEAWNELRKYIKVESKKYKRSE